MAWLRLMSDQKTCKQCSGCREIKSLSEFYRDASRRAGVQSCCKACSLAKNKLWLAANPIAAKTIQARNYQRHREVRLQYAKIRYLVARPQIRKYQREYEARREGSDLNFKLHRRLRLQIRNGAIKDGGRKCERTEVVLGCSVAEFRGYIEALFLPDMTWANYGSVWEVGHRKPRASFDISDPDQRKECYHYTNLFPQPVDKNRASGAIYEGVDFKGLKAAQYAVVTICLAQAKMLVEHYHYAGSSPSAATRCYGLIKKEAPETLLGAAIFRPAPIGAARAQCPEDPQKVLCLSRLIVVPEIPRNAASYFMARCLRQLGQEKKWKIVVTYADTWQGHDGSIYKAANWDYLGLTTPQPVWTLDGKFIGKRRGKQKPLTDIELTAMGATFHGRFAKHAYRYVLR